MKIERYEDNEYGFPFIAYISDNLTASPALIVQLHGAGERGCGGKELDLVLVHGFPESADCEKMDNCVIVMPQCPPDTFWVAKIESIKAFIDKMTALYSADKSRIYLTGMSMGGFGTWYTAMAYPDLFAAIAPCCGGGMPWNAGVLKMPVWAFHGGADDVVLPSNSIDMVNALKSAGGGVRFDLYDGVYHNSWEKAYTNELLEWLLDKNKNRK